MGDNKRPLIFEAVTYAPYVEGFKCGAGYAKHVAAQLRNAAPSDLDRSEKDALQVAIEIGDEVGDIITERENVGAIRPAFEAFGECWGGMHDALVAKQRLPAGVGKDAAARAAKLDALIFADRAAFIRLDARAAWVEGDRRIALIGQRGLERELAAIVGPEFLDAAKDATSDLREAVGAGSKAREIPSRTALWNAMVRFSRAISKYARLLAARVDEDDPASIERFRKAMAPLDEYRAARAGKPSDDDLEPPADPELEPVPAPGPEPIAAG